MVGGEQLTALRRSRVAWAALFPAALVAALLLPAVDGSAGSATFLTTWVRSTAVVLLLGVGMASVQMGHRWRAFTRHDSIRADIAAAGGLGKRLMV